MADFTNNRLTVRLPRRPFQALVECPIDTCDWTISADPYEPDQAIQFMIDPTGPGDLSDAINRAVNQVAIDRTKALDAKIRAHCETHDITDWIRTIHGLHLQLAQHDCGIRPHTVHSDPVE